MPKLKGITPVLPSCASFALLCFLCKARVVLYQFLVYSYLKKKTNTSKPAFKPVEIKKPLVLELLKMKDLVKRNWFGLAVLLFLAIQV